ncbi:hypothetical protein ACQ4PT_025612 [Festuca glaucescens]
MERRERFEAQFGAPQLPPGPSRKSKRVIEEGLNYVPLPHFHDYPAGFDLGGERLAPLNRELLKAYRSLHAPINKHSRAVAILELNRENLPRFQVEDLHAKSIEREMDLRNVFYQVLEHTQAGGLTMDPHLQNEAQSILSAVDKKKRDAQERHIESLRKYQEAEEKKREDKAKELLMEREKKSREAYKRVQKQKHYSARKLEIVNKKVVTMAKERLKLLQGENKSNEGPAKIASQKFRYPDGFFIGQGRRVAVLNTRLIPQFNKLSWLVKMHSTARGLKEALAETDDQPDKDKLKDTVKYYDYLVYEVSLTILELIGEIDAIGGQYAVPASLRTTLKWPRLNYRAQRGSLAWLCQPDVYVPEEYPLPDGTVTEAISALKSRYEELAYVVNRLKYFSTHLFIHETAVSDLERRLRSEFPEFPNFVDVEIFPIPEMLLKEIAKILPELEEERQKRLSEGYLWKQVMQVDKSTEEPASAT